MEPSIGLWAGVTGVLMILSGLFGMRVEVRGISGIAQDVKDAIAKIRSDIEDLKGKLDAKPVVTPQTTV